MTTYNLNEMAKYSNYEVYDSTGEHRDCTWYDLVKYKGANNPLVGLIDDRRMVVCRLSCNEQWWIVPQASSDEQKIDDIGPFENMGDALLHLKLHAVMVASD